jgi:hypothetical protein
MMAAKALFVPSVSCVLLFLFFYFPFQLPSIAFFSPFLLAFFFLLLLFPSASGLFRLPTH